MMSKLSKLLAFRPLVIPLRLLLGVVFVYAAIGKIQAPGLLAKNIVAYEMLNPRVINLMAIYLPWVELFTGIALVLGVFRRGAAFLCCAMLVMFCVALGFNWVLGNDIDCGCFGVIEPVAIPVIGQLQEFFFTSPKMTVTFWRDVVLLAMGLIVLYSPVVWRGAGRAAAEADG